MLASTKKRGAGDSAPLVGQSPKSDGEGSHDSTFGGSPSAALVSSLQHAREDDQADELRGQLAARGVEIPETDVRFWKFIAESKAH